MTTQVVKNNKNFKKKNKNGYKKFSRFMTGAGKVANVALKAMAIAKGVAALVNVEKKFIDLTQATPTAWNSGVILPLSLMAEGSGPSQRIGLSVRATSIQANLTIAINASSLPPNGDINARVMIFEDKFSNGVLALPAELFVDPTTPTSLLNINFGKRFRIVSDNRVCITYNALLTSQVTVYKKLNHHLKFSGNGATIGDVLSGALFMVIIHDASSTNAPLVSYSTRFRYIDN